MALNGRRGKVRDVRIVERRRNVDVRGQIAKARAENHPGMRRFIPGLTNRGGGSFDLVVEFEHGWLN